MAPLSWEPDAERGAHPVEPGGWRTACRLERPDLPSRHGARGGGAPPEARLPAGGDRRVPGHTRAEGGRPVPVTCRAAEEPLALGGPAERALGPAPRPRVVLALRGRDGQAPLLLQGQVAVRVGVRAWVGVRGGGPALAWGQEGLGSPEWARRGRGRVRGRGACAGGGWAPQQPLLRFGAGEGEAGCVSLPPPRPGPTSSGVPMEQGHVQVCGARVSLEAVVSVVRSRAMSSQDVVPGMQPPNPVKEGRNGGPARQAAVGAGWGAGRAASPPLT